MNWNEGKRRHRELSEAAAGKYDELYENANFATGSYMQYEVTVLERAAAMAGVQDVAVDLGCGTGRDTFVLARRFTQVFAYDFSESMIHEANRNKLLRGVGNVSFDVADVEDGLPMLDDDSVDLVNSSFGMGSFVDRPDEFFRCVRRVLRPGGIAVFSFYNKLALVNRLRLAWRPALAARTVPGADTLAVDFGGELFEIAAKAYEVPALRRLIEANFRIEELITFPTLTALFPQELFESPEARSLCRAVDELLATDLDLAAGPYIVAVTRLHGKPRRKPVANGYSRVLGLLRTHKIDVDARIRMHDRVRSMDDVRRVLPEASTGTMIKSILVSVRPEDADDHDERLFLLGVPADHRLDFGRVARLLDIPRRRLSMANIDVIERITGFKVGALPPFALPKAIPVILDSQLQHESHVWCGTGKSTESIRLTVAELKQLATPTFADIAKP